MPWNIPDEFNQFLQLIEGQTVIMGRRSYEIFCSHLTSKHNIVISRSLRQAKGAIVCPDIISALERAESFGKTVFSAGGATIYEQTIPLAKEMYLSYIKGSYDGDTFFPEFNREEWGITAEKEHPQFKFVHYTRREE